MRFAPRIGCLALCLAIAGQLPALARARSRRVLGIVVETERGHLDNALAQLGADVYSCDRLETEPNGVLRVSVGASQFFLSATSLAALEDDGNAIQAVSMGGTVGFSSPASANFSVRTPAGIVRAAGDQAASGQVTYLGPQKLLISAIHGDLTLDSGVEPRTIPEGRSAEVTFDSGLDEGCHDESAAADQTQVKPYAQRKIAFYLIMGAAAAISSYFIWRDIAESASTPSQ